MPKGHFETRLSKRGYPVQIWVRDMPRLPDNIVDCVVYLYPSEAAAEDGEMIGGTGFLVGLPLANSEQMIVAHLPCVVTNRHIVENGSMIVRLNTRDGKTDIVALDGAEWIFHPDGDDIAVCPIGIHFMHKHHYIPAESLGNRGLVDGMEVGIGEEAIVVGRFINKEGRQQNTPSVRFGNIAQMPNDPIIQDNGFPQESFLVEVRSISGYSGSPVFWYIPPQPSLHFTPEMEDHVYAAFPLLRKKRRNLQTGFGPQLLGISYCYIPTREPVRNVTTGEPVPNMFVRSNTGMMGVIPAWKITEMLLGEPMAKITEDAERQLKKTKAGDGVVLTSAESSAPPANGENPTHREDFMRLVGAAARKPAPKD